MIELHQYFFLGFYVINLLLLNDVDLFHNLQSKDFTGVLESYQFHTTKCTVSQRCDYFEQVNMNIGIAHNDYISVPYSHKSLLREGFICLFVVFIVELRDEVDLLDLLETLLYCRHFKILEPCVNGNLSSLT
jgi:hypothetical protein